MFLSSFKFYRTILILLLCFNKLYAQELEEISAEEFLAKNPSPEREEIINFIVHQFDNKLESGVTQEQLDSLWNNNEARQEFFISRFQIVDNKLYADSVDLNFPFYIEFLNYLQKLLYSYKIPDVDFIFHMKDGIFANQSLREKFLNIPSFLMSKDLKAFYENDRLLLPDLFMMGSNWYELKTRIETSNNIYPWSDKINQIFWRGFTTGNGEMEYSIDNFDKFPRLTLVMLSKLYPDLIDAKFNRFSFDKNKSGEDLRLVLNILSNGVPESEIEKTQTIPEEDHLKYKYLISIDGNTCAWMRVPWIMLSNSVLVKQETSKMEWFYPAIKPYVHYVPVNERLTDLLSQIQWMKTHDLELEKISANAQNFVKNNLMPEHIDAYSVIILNEYHKLHKGSKLIPTLPPAEESFIKLEALKKNKSENSMSIGKKIKRFFRKIKQRFEKLCI